MHRKLVRNVGQHCPTMCQPVYGPPMSTLFMNCLQDDASQNVLASCVQGLWAGRQSLLDVATGLQSMNSLEKRIEELKSWLHSVELQLVTPIVLEQCSEPGLNKCLAHHDVSSSIILFLNKQIYNIPSLLYCEVVKAWVSPIRHYQTGASRFSDREQHTRWHFVEAVEFVKRDLPRSLDGNANLLQRGFTKHSDAGLQTSYLRLSPPSQRCHVLP